MNKVQLSATDGSVPGVTEGYSYNALNRVSSYTDWAGNVFEYEYNPDGRVAQVSYEAFQPWSGTLAVIVTGRWTYDAAGRLLEVQYRRGSGIDGAVVAQATYGVDAAGNRISRQDLSGTSSYGYDGVYELTDESDSADVRGNQTFAYDAAGNRIEQTLGTQTLAYDIPNNLNRWNRWYDPSIGRWISEDPIRQAGGLNLYEYVTNNPVSYVDPTGRAIGVDDAAAAAAGIVLVGAAVGAADGIVTYQNTGSISAAIQSAGSGFVGGAASAGAAVITAASGALATVAAAAVDIAWDLATAPTSVPPGTTSTLPQGVQAATNPPASCPLGGH